MIRKLLLFFLSSTASLDAFLTPSSTITITATSLQKRQPRSSSPLALAHRRPSSKLRADASSDSSSENDDGAHDDPSESSSSSSSSSEPKTSLLPSEEESDILSSPTFLKRKVEVLQSDIAALEKEIEEATAVVAKGKEEWAAKFDMLNKEVSRLYSMMY